MSDAQAMEDLLLAALAGLLPEQEPEEQTKQRLRAALLARVRPVRTVVTRSDTGQWLPILRGVQVKILRHDTMSGTQTTLWRMQPGAKIPAHTHRLEEECLMIEGSIVQDGTEYLPGDFLLAMAGSEHTPFESPHGALFLIRGERLPEADALKT